MVLVLVFEEAKKEKNIGRKEDTVGETRVNKRQWDQEHRGHG